MPPRLQGYPQMRWLADRVLDPYARTILQLMLPILEDKEPVTMADIQQALADLDAAIESVKQRTQEDFDSLRAEFDAFKASNPGADTAALEAAVGQIEQRVTDLNSIDLTPAQAEAGDGGTPPADGGTPPEEPPA